MGALLVVVVVVVLTLLSDRPPSPVPASAPSQEFSAQRALVPLREFATELRPLGSAASDRARDYLTGSVVLAAHYDSVAAGPGASDDGAAIAAMLETVRALRGDDQLRNDLVLLITDGCCCRGVRGGRWRR